MALLFSAVTVTANNQEVEFLVGGIPREFDDLDGWTAFDNFMEETVKLIHQKVMDCVVMVGGAVLTQEYADSIGADKYAKDALEGVRYAESII